MKKIGLIVSMTTILAACGGSGGSGSSAGTTTDPAVQDLSVPDLGQALTDPVNTADLTVDQDFAFDTARNVAIDFDIEAAAGNDASVSVCTEYEKQGDAFDVNYESCTVQGELDNGKFNHAMEVTNQFDSVVGVVWFQDPSMAPLHKEFHVDATPRMKSDGSMQRRIVWK